MGADNHLTVDVSDGRGDKPLWIVVDRSDRWKTVTVGHRWNTVTVGHFLRKKDAEEVASKNEHYTVRKHTAYGSVHSFESDR